mmetsp:Transcript_8169/g.11244  ORF Transcript_8169/g.11244 Transcript_8169/m.11244 type:complete len:253 (-) Transcript_8169:1552-2310(-)
MLVRSPCCFKRISCIRSVTFHQHRQFSVGSNAHNIRIVLIGAPGSGKGTQATYLKEDFGLSSISTGQILRNAVAEKTPVGQQVEKIMATGGLVGDNIVLDLVRKTLTELKNQKRGWVLDGYPRTLNQATQLSDLLKAIEQPLSVVFYLKVSENTIYERIKDRWIHLPSGRDYNLVYKPPKVPFKDDVTGEPLVQRPDDTLEAIRSRLKHYHESTLPILQHFEKQSLLQTIEAPTSKEGYVYIKKFVTDFLGR